MMKDERRRKRRLRWIIAAVWVLGALLHLYWAWHDGDGRRWASVAMYAGLALLWVGMAREIQDE